MSWIDPKAKICPFCRKKNPLGRVNPFGCQTLFAVFFVSFVVAIVSVVLGGSDSLATVLFFVVFGVLFVLSCIAGVAQFFEKS